MFGDYEGDGFQSPSGVLGVCRELKFSEAHDGLTIEFQSPSGVLGVCRTAESNGDKKVIGAVSVPFRGFRGLQGPMRLSTMLWPWSPFQSPSGVLGVCRAGKAKEQAGQPCKFQSPSGVLGVCRGRLGRS